MKKRLLILMLALVMALCVFVSCGDEEETDPSNSTGSSTTSSSDDTSASSKPTTESKPPVIEGGDEDCNHTWVSESKTEATCKDEGVENFKCSKCNATKSQPLAVSSIHSYEVVETTEATCQVAATVKKKCKVCEKEETTTTGEPKKHQAVETIVTDATCDKDGVKKMACSMCGTSVIVPNFDSVIPKKGHSYEKADNILESAEFVAADCENDGYFKLVCTDCDSEGNVITREQYEGMATNPLFDESKLDKMTKKGHNFETLVQEVPSTCVVNGYSEYKCTRCETTEKRDSAVALGHSYVKDGTGVEGTDYVIVTPANCLTAGKKAFICKKCGEQGTEGDGVETIAKLDHNYDLTSNDYQTVEATCSVVAYKVYKCNVTAACTETKIVYEENGKLRDHKWEKTGEPSCLTEGNTPAKCSYADCGATGYHPDIPAVDIKHEIGEVISPATCALNAKYKCKHCDAEYGPYEGVAGYENGFATGEHDYLTPVKVPETCSEEGYTIYYCSDPTCEAKRFNPNPDEPDVPRAEDIVARAPHNFDTNGDGVMDFTPDGRIVCKECKQQYRDVTTQISKGEGKLCLGCDAESIDTCTCGLDVKWTGYVSPSVPEEHEVAAGSSVTISSVNWKQIAVEDGGGEKKLALGNGIIRIKGASENATYTITIYDKKDSTEAVGTLTATGIEAFVDLYNFAEVGKVTIESNVAATVFLYEEVTTNN